MKNKTIKKELKELILKQKIDAGFSGNGKKITIYTPNCSFTLCSGKNGLEMGIPLPMEIEITPKQVICNYVGLLGNNYLLMGLGRNRALAIQSSGRKGLNVTYLPDEADLEYGRSEFMNRCENRGLM